MSKRYAQDIRRIVGIDPNQSKLKDIDEKDLRRCAYQYVRTRNKTYYRELFRMIKAAIESQVRSNNVDS